MSDQSQRHLVHVYLLSTPISWQLLTSHFSELDDLQSRHNFAAPRHCIGLPFFCSPGVLHEVCMVGTANVQTQGFLREGAAPGGFCENGAFFFWVAGDPVFRGGTLLTKTYQNKYKQKNNSHLH